MCCLREGPRCPLRPARPALPPAPRRCWSAWTSPPPSPPPPPSRPSREAPAAAMPSHRQRDPRACVSLPGGGPWLAVYPPSGATGRQGNDGQSISCVQAGLGARGTISFQAVSAHGSFQNGTVSLPESPGSFFFPEMSEGGVSLGVQTAGYQHHRPTHHQNDRSPSRTICPGSELHP